MNKIEKVWLRLSNPYTLNKNFTASYYRDLICEWKEKYGFSDFYSQGNGIILRHDIDLDLDKSVKMAEIEANGNNLNDAMFNHGVCPIVHSTYFILNTKSSGYWKSAGMIDAIKYIQSLGHEIGFHNNAITEHLQTGKSLSKCISEPLYYLRSHGIMIRGSAAHGDRLCYKEKYVNYNVFGFKSPGWDWQGETFDMSKFGLEYEAYHVPYDEWLSDNHYGWAKKYDQSNWKGKRVQIVVHPQNWRI